jgi:hypothetical protein
VCRVSVWNSIIFFGVEDMDVFECKAPMYVNFAQSSALDEDDGADTFFGKYNKGT